MPDTPQTQQQQPIDLQTELANIAASFQPQQPRPGKAQAIMGALQNAVAILASKDPSATITAQQQARTEQQNKLLALQQSQQLALQNFRLQDLANRLQEQRNVEKEVRTEEVVKRAELRAEDRDVRNYWREQFGREDIEKMKFGQAKELTEINFKNTKALAEQNNEYAQKLAELNAKNERMGSIAKFTLPLLYSGKIPGDKAYEIYKEIEEKGAPSAANGSLIGKASADLRKEEQNFELRKTALMHRATGGGGRSPGYLDIEEIQKLATKIASTEELYRMPDGTVQFGQRNAAGMIEPPRGGNRLSLAEATKYVFDEYVPIIQGFGRSPSNTAQGGDTEVRVKTLEEQIKQSGATDPAIISAALDQLVQQNPADAAAASIIKTRLKNTAPQAKGAVKNAIPEAQMQEYERTKQKPGSTNLGIGNALKSIFKSPYQDTERTPQY